MKAVRMALIVVVVFGAGIMSAYLFVMDSSERVEILNIVNESRVAETFVQKTEQVREIVGEVVHDVPLVVERVMEPAAREKAQLTSSGLVLETNVHRISDGLNPVRANSLLNAAAMAKAKDLFARQYFAHESPTGEMASDLVKDQGYEFLTIGENLASGVYEGDADLVQAWMDSPGHRENILNGEYEEIGVAVLRGEFEGNKTWMGVQIFARPRSSCPVIDENLKVSLGIFEGELKELVSSSDVLRANVESQRPRNNQEYEVYKRLVDEYNGMVNMINSLNDELQEKIDIYNVQVRAFNSCIGK